jgi:nucleotide-binding universal stress UspA family protein
MLDDMKWIVGTDFGERSVGALRMGAWLREHAGDRGASALVGVHVLDERVRTMFDEERAEQLMAASSEVLQRQVDGLEIASSFTELRTVLAESPELGLTAAADTIGIDAVVIGRAARSDDATPLRLGRVARRLLRHLPAPVMAVPPDLAEIGSGPILLATDLTELSVAAAELAARLAQELQRELLVAHVDLALVLTTSEIGYGIALPLEMRPRTLDGVQQWIRAQRLGPASARLLEGDVVERLLHCAREVSSPLIVCGSRHLGLAERIFSSSVGTELARRADRAVLVVPPHAAASPPSPGSGA